MGRRGGGWRAPGAWGPIAAIAGSLLLPAALAVRRRLSASRRRVKELQVCGRPLARREGRGGRSGAGREQEGP